jgi:hypothetical protein
MVPEFLVILSRKLKGPPLIGSPLETTTRESGVSAPENGTGRETGCPSTALPPQPPADKRKKRRAKADPQGFLNAALKVISQTWPFLSKSKYPHADPHEESVF